jgi:hypothetical protein
MHKISIILALMGGILPIFFGLTIIFRLLAGRGTGTWDVSGLANWFSLFLFVIPFLSFTCATCLLFVPTTSENRAILGFVSFIGSVVPVLFLVMLLSTLIFHPTGM